jgi:hypothetical protein
MERYRIGKSILIVTKPTGEVVKREVELHFDTLLRTFGVRFVGESPLKGYCFELIENELERIRDLGQPIEYLPTIE